MRSNIEAKKILKAFGKEAYIERIKYVDSFMPEKILFIRSISYRHTFRRVVTIALLVILIMVLAISAYAGVIHYFNYTKIVHADNDEYIFNNEYINKINKTDYFIPTYVPAGYSRSNEYSDEKGDQKTFVYEGKNNESLVIKQSLNRSGFHIDNERSESKTVIICDIEVIIYDFSDEIMAVFQYNNNWITIAGKIDETEVEKIIIGMNIPD